MGTAVVSGSASGIGAAVRSRLEREGDRVIGIDVRDAEILVDLSSRQGRDAALAAAAEQCGDRLDRLVLSAGLGVHVAPISLIASVNYFGAVELLDGVGEVPGMRPDQDRPGQGGDFHHVRPAHLGQRSAHEDDVGEHVELAKLAHRVAEPDAR